MPTRLLRIRGVVQGVGFRYALCDEARRLRLTGWVRNRRDGSVEALAIGDPAALDALARWAQRGPPGAWVEEVVSVEPTGAQIAELGVAAGATFTQAPTV
jgi:acylphosphatase